MAKVSIEAISNQLRNALAYAQSQNYNVATTGPMIRVIANQLKQYQVTWDDLYRALPGKSAGEIARFFAYYDIDIYAQIYVPDMQTIMPLPHALTATTPAPPAGSTAARFLDAAAQAAQAAQGIGAGSSTALVPSGSGSTLLQSVPSAGDVSRWIQDHPVLTAFAAILALKIIL